MISKIRKLICLYWLFKAKKIVANYTSEPKIFGKTILTDRTSLGKNCNFNGMIVRGYGEVTIGDNFHSGTECLIITDVHNYEGEKIPYDSSYIVKNVVIGENVWIGSRVIILGGVEIGEGAIIQAGSVVVSNIPACSIAGGHPAKVFSTRSKEHYYSRKNDGLFH